MDEFDYNLLQQLWRQQICQFKLLRTVRSYGINFCLHKFLIKL